MIAGTLLLCVIFVGNVHTHKHIHTLSIVGRRREDKWVLKNTRTLKKIWLVNIGIDCNPRQNATQEIALKASKGQ